MKQKHKNNLENYLSPNILAKDFEVTLWLCALLIIINPEFIACYSLRLHLSNISSIFNFVSSFFAAQITEIHEIFKNFHRTQRGKNVVNQKSNRFSALFVFYQKEKNIILF